MADQPLLKVENLNVEFHARGKIVKAVRNVSWSVNRGETLAILGESGSGKSVSSAAVMGLIDRAIGGGRLQIVWFELDKYQLLFTFACVLRFAVVLFLAPGLEKKRVPARRASGAAFRGDG